MTRREKFSPGAFLPTSPERSCGAARELFIRSGTALRTQRRPPDPKPNSLRHPPHTNVRWILAPDSPHCHTVKPILPRLTTRLAFFGALCATVLHPICKAQEAAASGTKSPEWLRRSVVYELFPRNFSAAGDFNSITERLGELEKLGVDLLWLLPINPTGQKMKKGTLGSPYAVRDYLAVNPDCGTPADLKRLVDAAHQRGMKVILDIVAGHTSWDNVLMKDHPEFYKRDEQGNIIPPNPDWTDVAALDYSKPEVRRYMIDMLKFWLTEYKVDGFRSDVAFTVPIEFWESARAELEAVHPELIMLADANAQPALLAKAFNMDKSGALYSALSRVMSGISPATLIKQSWESTRKQFPPGALHLRFTDSHENVRAVARYGINGAVACQVLMMTLDGVPLFYNGMEVGDATESADPALFEKMPVNWSTPGRPPLRQVYGHLAKLRKEHPAFCNDTVAWLDSDVSDDVVTFLRKDEKDEFVVCINFSSRLVRGSVEVPNAEKFKVLKIDGTPDVPASMLPDFILNGYGWVIYHRSLRE